MAFVIRQWFSEGNPVMSLSKPLPLTDALITCFQVLYYGCIASPSEEREAHC